MLIVCEGSKTEPQYFKEICVHYRLHTANVQVQHGELGTQPMQVVEYAKQLFTDGNAAKNIQKRAFERVFAVFDRDEHATYHDALIKAAALEGKLRNDLSERVTFKAIASVPSFELWLLLHFEQVLAPMHRDDALRRLRKHLPDYHKGQQGNFQQTQAHINAATLRAQHLAGLTTAHNAVEPYTDVYELVNLLTTLKTE